MVVDQESSLKELNLKNKPVMGGGWPEEAAGRWPQWLRRLLAVRFFGQCALHADAHRRECNMFCLDCADGALCSLCLAHRHRDHHTIQIRRSSYHDVIRVSEIQKVLDIAGVQTYIINSARIVFLNERPQPRPGKGVGNACEACDRSLLDSFCFCSLGCKVAGTGKKSPLERQPTASGSDDSFASSSLESARTQSFTPSASPPSAQRRKGIPHRAPFGSLIFDY
ncbi:protein RGF1 INDUCIBLE TRANSCRIPTION FACTOR 1-like [Curcuma longa]|uniref:protein RGF1 INDUCIBLE TRANSCRIPTION FACTOR 1-like n=1 Tax=Curcuma longa TaxID=136217 RepID=UPI003D9EE42D